MNKIRLILVASLAVFIATSCTVEHTIDYNQDMSGTNQIIIDYGDVMEQMGSLMGDSMGSLGDMDMQEGLGDLEESFEDIKGIDKIMMINETEDQRLGFSFDFDDTKALNEAMSSYMENDEEVVEKKKKKAAKSYVQKKKALMLDFKNSDMAGITENLGEPSMAMMMSMFDYDLTIRLPHQVKSVNNPLYTLSEDRKSLNATINFEDMINGTEDLSAKIKW